MKPSKIFCTILILTCSGCQPALINMPDCPVVECSTYEKIRLPDKLPDTINISINPGKNPIVDEGGKRLLSDYRDMIRAVKQLNE